MNRCKLVDICPLKGYSSSYKSTVTTTSHQMKFPWLKFLRNDMERPILNTSTSHGEWISFLFLKKKKNGLSLLTAMQRGADSERRWPICWCKCTSALNELLYPPIRHIAGLKCCWCSQENPLYNKDSPRITSLHKKVQFLQDDSARHTHTQNLNISGHLGVRYPHTNHDAQWGYCVH